MPEQLSAERKRSCSDANGLEDRIRFVRSHVTLMLIPTYFDVDLFDICTCTDSFCDIWLSRSRDFFQRASLPQANIALSAISGAAERRPWLAVLQRGQCVVHASFPSSTLNVGRASLQWHTIPGGGHGPTSPKGNVTEEG